MGVAHPSRGRHSPANPSYRRCRCIVLRLNLSPSSSPANAGRSAGAGAVLAHCVRSWPNIVPHRLSVAYLQCRPTLHSKCTISSRYALCKVSLGHRHLHSYLYCKRSDQSMATVHIYRNRQGMKRPLPPPTPSWLYREIFWSIFPISICAIFSNIASFSFLGLIGQDKCRHETT